MLRRKFVPPLLKKTSKSDLNAPKQPTYEPPNKRVKVDHNENVDCVPESDDEDGEPRKPAVAVPVLPVVVEKKILVPLQSTKSVVEKSDDAGFEGYYNVLWRKPTTKKHKTWDGDGVLVIMNGFAVLQDTSGKDLGRARVTKPLTLGDQISVGSKDVEIDSILSRVDFLAGRPFLKSSSKAAAVEVTPTVAPGSFYVKTQFKTPLIATTVYKPTVKDGKPTPRHDPEAEGALIMKRPPKAPASKRIVDVVVDPFICHHLRPHQREGVAFMYESVMGLREFEGDGAILADEMGLGKTLQTIALLWTLLKQNPIYEQKPVIQKALIVCPVTLINNWKKEFRKWLGNERIGVFIADGKTKIRDFTHSHTYSVMIVGYERLRSILDELKKCQIDIIIADEGHRLKTAQNKSAQAIRELKTTRRVILSGTPLQNDLSEFFVMVDFVNPGIFENWATFKKEFEAPILKSRQPGVSKKDKEKGEERGKELVRLTKLFILRRTADVLSKYLPPKTEFVVFCKPTSPQLEIYRTIIETKAFKQILANPECSLQLITLLKKVCNSPALLLKEAEDADENHGSSSIKSILEDSNVAKFRTNVTSSSGKLKVLDKMLKVLKETTNEKIVLVSNYTSTLDMLQNLLNIRGYTFLRMDGKTPANKRQDLVDKFNRTDSNKAFAFLLSSKSGGAGINLIGASRLVLFDSDWNPANDLQSMGRVHRDGQRKHVYIYRMLTTGCLDEKIYQRQITKQGLADSVMDQKSGGSTFSASELKDLFSLDEGTGCNTHDLLGCTCGGNGEVLDMEESKCFKTEPSSEVLDLVNVEEEDDCSKGFVKASQVNQKDIEGSVKKSKEAMKALLEYVHIDTARLVKKEKERESGEDVDDEVADEDEIEIVVEDEVLRRVIGSNGEKRISFLFSKSS